MAVAAFKSSSRRGNQNQSSSNTPSSSSSARSYSNNNNHRAPIRRSRSVSAFPRSSTTTSLDVSTEFLNKRNNPLFDEISQSNEAPPLLETSTPDAIGAVRGRSVARNAEPGQSMSRVDTGRRTRSASQCPVSRRHLNYSTSEVSSSPPSLIYIGL